jgi:hypothetical protein
VPQRMLNMLFGVGSLAALAALWMGVLTYGIRPNVSALGMGQLMSLIALPPLGLWGISTGGLWWRKHQATQLAAAKAESEQAEHARQEALAQAARARELAERQRPLVIRVAVQVNEPVGDIPEAGLGMRCAALTQAALTELREAGAATPRLPVLAQVPLEAAAAVLKIASGVTCFEHSADLLRDAFQCLDDADVAGVIVLATDAPRALLDAAPTRFNPDTLQDEPDIDLPLRGEAGQVAVVLLVTREDGMPEAGFPMLAHLHRPGGSGTPSPVAEALASAAMNGRLLRSDADAPVPPAPGMLLHTAGTDKAGGSRLAKLAMHLPEFSRELDIVDDALNVPRALADFGGASFWVAVARAIDHVNEHGTPALCVDCISAEHMVAVVINPASAEAEV